MFKLEKESLKTQWAAYINLAVITFFIPWPNLRFAFIKTTKTIILKRK